MAKLIIEDMSSNLSKAGQQTAIGEGLAIGCLVLGHAELSANKFNVELAFQKAWRGWPHARLFPQVRADLAQNDIYYRIMGKSENRRGPTLAYWEVDRTIRPQLVEGSKMDDAKDLIEEFYGLPVSAWVDLARAFCENSTGDRGTTTVDS